MNLTLKIKLCPDEVQSQALKNTMTRFNAACDFVAGVAFEQRLANKIAIQKLIYRDVREKFGLSAQLAILAIRKVVEAYKRDRSIQPTFRPFGAMVYDQRVLSWKGLDVVSILTLDGRLRIPIHIGDYHRTRMNRIRGQADLIFVDGGFYLCVVVDVPEPEKIQPTETLGIDLGIINLATDSDGDKYTGEMVEKVRGKNAKIRSKLQHAGTRSAKRHLKRISGYEERFRRNTNHCISKGIVTKAKGTQRRIAVEDLGGIRNGTTVRKAQRGRHSSWGFGQLRSFIEYKAMLAGVPVVAVDPRNTSRTCPNCQTIDKMNRDGESFRCVSCGYAGHADHTAAINIAARANVSMPIVACIDAGTLSQAERSYKPTPFRGG
jgi:IS605 OrfB family transposase